MVLDRRIGKTRVLSVSASDAIAGERMSGSVDLFLQEVICLF
jgi:hypothetical protein